MLQNMVLTYRVQSEHPVELDEAMEPAKQDVRRQVNHLCWMSREVFPQLHCLAEDERPCQQRQAQDHPLLRGPSLCGLVPGPDEQRVVGQRPGRDSGL